MAPPTARRGGDPSGGGERPDYDNVTTRRAEDKGGRGVRSGWVWCGLLAVTGWSGVVLTVLARRLPPTEFARCATVLTAGLVLAVLPGALQLRAAAAATDGR